MKFYNREKEIKELKKIYKKSGEKAHFGIILGRRRIGKTRLILNSLPKKGFNFYFFVSKKKLHLILEEIEKTLREEKIPYLGKIDSLETLFKILFDFSKNKPLIVVFDEVQNFKWVEPSFFSVLQKYWDLNKEKSKICFILIGSLTSLMKKIFLSSKEPLFGRTTNKLEIYPLDILVIKEILKDFKIYSPLNLIKFYSVFGGIPEYYNLIDVEFLKRKSLKEILKHLIFRKEAILKNEGQILIQEGFGKNYYTYFSILEVIARGKTKLSEISNSSGISINSIGKYLKELEQYFQLAERRFPIFSKKPITKLSRWYIKDNFLRFWFRYIYKNLSFLEQQQEEKVLKETLKDLPNILGFTFEEIIKELLIKLNRKNRFIFRFDEIGSFWTRKNNQIDIICANEKTKEIFFSECKLSSKRVNLKLFQELREKSRKVKWNLDNRKEYFGIFTLDKPNQKLKNLLKKENIFHWNLEDLY